VTSDHFPGGAAIPTQRDRMAIDNHLQRAAEAMIACAQDGRSVIPVLKQRCPHIHRQIVADGKQRDLLALWGRSCNFDENAGQVIVHPAILHAIGELAGVPLRGRFVHAGLAHTYGYLFSTIDTPYGRKRDRWVTTDLENGFGLDPSLLGDRPRHGTLLGNLTQFLGRMVFRGLPGAGILDRHTQTAAAEIVRLDYAGLQTRRIVEQIALSGKTNREILLLTDLVPFPRLPRDAHKDRTLLIYSIQRSHGALPKLITAFPVADQTAKDLMPAGPATRKVRLRLRYNAYVPELFGHTVWGHRTLAAPLA
jgi:hypothetical protein